MGRVRCWWGVGLALAAFALCWLADPVAATIDPETLTVSDERLPAGVPLGGIGTGKVDLLTDGSFGNLTANNNWARPIQELPGSFFAIRTEHGAGAARRSDARVLALSSEYGFPAVNSVRYQGRFPEASVRYSHPSLPLAVSLRAAGSFIPRNVKDSSLPQATFSFTLGNPGTTPVDATLAFSWENVVGCGGSSKEIWRDRTGNRQAIQINDGRILLVFQSSAQPQGERGNALGEYAITGAAEGARFAALPFWNAGGDGKEFWTSFASGPLFEQKPPVLQGREGSVHPAGALAATVQVPPGGASRVDFVLAWHMPRVLLPDGKDLGHGYANTFASATAVAEYALRYRETLRSGTEQWHELLVKSSLPDWFKARLLTALSPMVANSLLTRASQFYLLDSLEDPLARIGATEHWLVANTAAALLFPELERDALRQAAGLQGTSGEFPRAAGSLDKGVAAGSEPVRPDAACQFVLSAYRHYRWTGDADGMRIAYPAVIQGLQWLHSLDTDGDGLPEGATAWAQREPGTFSYTAGLYLAALRAGEELARVTQDRKLAEELGRRVAVGRASAVAELWNGRLFTRGQDPATGQRSENLFAGSLAGEWAGWLLGLPEVYDRRLANTALRRLMEQFSVAGLHVPPNEIRPDGAAEAASADQAWSGYQSTYLAALAIARGHPDAGLALARRLHEAEAIRARAPFAPPRGCDPRTGRAISPASDATALGSWNLYCAYAGLEPDEPARILGVSPSLPGSVYGLHAPLFTPRYWAWVDFARSPHNAGVNLRLKLVKKLDDAPVTLNGLATGLPLASTQEDLSVIVTGPAGALAGKVETGDGRVLYRFEAPFEWRPGETLEMTVVPADANNLMLQFDPPRVWNYGSAVTARDLVRERDIRFTLENPTKERQLVNVRFRESTPRNYEVYQSGVKLPYRFTPDTPNEKLGLLIPASPIGVDRIDRIRSLDERLAAARKSAEAEGRLAAIQPHVDPLRARLAAALQEDARARAVQIVLAPVGNRLIRTRVRAQPPVIPAGDPEPAVVAAEEAIAAGPARAMNELKDDRALALFLGAYYPVTLQVDSPGSIPAGSKGRVRVTAANSGPAPVRVAVGFTYPADWITPEEPPTVLVPPGGTQTLTIELGTPAGLPPARVPLAGRAILTTTGAAWTLPLRTTLNRAFLKSWSVIGLWPSTARSLDEPRPPDTELEPTRAYEGRRWRVVASLTDRFDLAAAFVGTPGALGYAVSQVYSPREQDAVLELGCEGRYLLRVNGAAVLDRRTGARAVPAAERVNIRLRQGWNILLLKLERPAGDSWGLYAEVVTPEGATPDGMRTSPNLVP